MDREEEIKVIAYGIWEKQGCADGCALDHWLKAEFFWTERQSAKTFPPVDNDKSKLDMRKEDRANVKGENGTIKQAKSGKSAGKKL